MQGTSDGGARQPEVAVCQQHGDPVGDRGGDVPKPLNVVGHGRAVYGRVARSAGKRRRATTSRSPPSALGWRLVRNARTVVGIVAWVGFLALCVFWLVVAINSDPTWRSEPAAYVRTSPTGSCGAPAVWVVSDVVHRIQCPHLIQQRVTRRPGDHDGPATQRDPDFVDPTSGHAGSDVRDADGRPGSLQSHPLRTFCGHGGKVVVTSEMRNPRFAGVP